MSQEIRKQKDGIIKSENTKWDTKEGAPGVSMACPGKKYLLSKKLGGNDRCALSSDYQWGWYGKKLFKSISYIEEKSQLSFCFSHRKWYEKVLSSEVVIKSTQPKNVMHQLIWLYFSRLYDVCGIYHQLKFIICCSHIT